ncbi:MAG: hypothetical protein FJ263_10825 [Planctomycetes bacterium]|nr:hypothetical protein [Planctomycetota bacterium]
MNRKAVVMIVGLAVLGYSVQAAQWQYKNNYLVSQVQSRAYSATAEDPIGARGGAMAGSIYQDPYSVDFSIILPEFSTRV